MSRSPLPSVYASTFTPIPHQGVPAMLIFRRLTAMLFLTSASWALVIWAAWMGVKGAF